MSTESPVGISDSQLAVLLRQAQWALDDAAHEVPAGRATVRRRVELAGTLEALALVLRASAPQSAGQLDGGPDGGPVDEIIVEEWRGWCVTGCGCALDVPPDGAVFVDCSTCAPTPAPAPPSGQRPESGSSVTTPSAGGGGGGGEVGG